jgi:hypothetical protein
MPGFHNQLLRSRSDGQQPMETSLLKPHCYGSIYGIRSASLRTGFKPVPGFAQKVGLRWD